MWINRERKMITENDLIQFSGTEGYHKLSVGFLKFTDGMAFLAKEAGCFWLMDIVQSVQHFKKIQDNSSFIVWRIEVDENKSWTVSAWDDFPGNCLYIQEGNYTDFPFSEFEFYQEWDVCLLKSEH